MASLRAIFSKSLKPDCAFTLSVRLARVRVNVCETTIATPRSYKQSKKKVNKVLDKSKISVYICTPQERDVPINY